LSLVDVSGALARTSVLTEPRPERWGAQAGDIDRIGA
jgi:hypothetical protein